MWFYIGIVLPLYLLYFFLGSHYIFLSGENYGVGASLICLSLILQGHEKEALNLMSSYLPKDSSGTYAEGGGLFAIGMHVCTSVSAVYVGRRG